jgi:hypothetical protein
MDRPHLFSRLMQRQQAFRLDAANRGRVWPLVPASLRDGLAGAGFYVMSVFRDGRAAGLFYADVPGGPDDQLYARFRGLCTAAVRALRSPAPQPAAPGESGVRGP